MQKIPVTVITGFLGSGKTTLIRHLLTHNQGLRIAVLVNEFGELGIDGELLKACSDCPEQDIVELTNGCVCCTVQEEFLPVMEQLLERRDKLDHILIETSGLALPKPLIQAFRWPQIAHAATVDGVVTLVDGDAVASGQLGQSEPGSAHETPLEELFEDQLACADLVILNKADLLDADRLAQVEAQLRAQLPARVKVLTACSGQLDARVLLGFHQAVEENLATRPSHHDTEEDHDHDEAIDSVSLRIETPLEPERLIERLEHLVATMDIYRVKGFVYVAAKPMRLVVQGVGKRFERYYDRAWRPGEPRRTDLVLIGRDLDSRRIEAVLLM